MYSPIAAPAPIPASAPAPIPASAPAQSLIPVLAPAPIPVSAPTPAISSHRPVLNMQLDNYLRREYPGYILQNVTGDGSCQMGALGVGLTNNQDDKYILGRASNKFMLENWQFYGSFHDYDKAFRVGSTDRMFEEEELFIVIKL